MWINPMLTIWLWGTIFALLLISFSLWWWYWRAGAAEPQAGRVVAGQPKADRSRADDRG